VPGSTLKGVYAAHWGADQTKRADKTLKIGTAFGRQLAQAEPTAEDIEDKTTAPDNAGSLMFTDLRILALPVRSLWGTFAWVTCPSVLKRYQSDLALTGSKTALNIPQPQANEIAAGSALQSANAVVLEDLELKAMEAIADKSFESCANVLAEAVFKADERDHFKQRLAIVHDDVFNFLSQTALEIRTRIKIDPNSGIVAKGQLWTEEALPTETLLQGLVCCEAVYGSSSNDTPTNLLDQFCGAGQDLVLQIGGKASTGKGLARVMGLKKQTTEPQTQGGAA
jgi:CRISPR-associated protein Cmr4